MAFDIALAATLVTLFVLGFLFGRWTQLGLPVGAALGMLALPWVRASTLAQSLPAKLGLRPEQAAQTPTALTLVTPALLVWLLTSLVGMRETAPNTPKRMLAGGAWALLGAGVAVVVLGYFAAHDPAAVSTSRAFTEVSQRTAPVTQPAVIEPAPADVRIDYAAMRKDPRLRAALKDPVVRRAMETGNFTELEKRNRLLRPIEHASQRTAADSR
jgi:hypothetical protein